MRPLVQIVAIALSSVSWPAAGQAADAKRGVEQEVQAAVKAFFNGFSAATCENGRPVSDLVKDNSVYVLDSEIHRVPISEYEEGVRQRACNWKKHTGSVNSVVVDVHAPTVATAAWTFHDKITRKDDSVLHLRGAVMQTWVKEATGWKVAATKDSIDEKLTVVDPAPSK